MMTFFLRILNAGKRNNLSTVFVASTKWFIELDRISCLKNMPGFFTVRGHTPVELGCLRNVCTPLNPMFYCLDLDYRRGLFRHDLYDVPSRVFVLFLLWHISLFSFVDVKQVLTDVFKAKDTFAARDKTSDENEDPGKSTLLTSRNPHRYLLMTFFILARSNCSKL